MLLEEVLARNQRAWAELVRRHEPAIRDAVREIVCDSDDVDDVVGAFWLRMLERDMRWLRAFAPDNGTDLCAWLSIHAAQIANDHRRKRERERRRTTSLDYARTAAAVEPTMTTHTSVDRAIRDAVRDVVREEIETLRRTMESSAAPTANRSANEYLSIADAAEFVGVHPATVRGWINEGRLRGHRAGRHHRVKRAELELFLASMDQMEDVDLDRRARELATA